MNCIARWPYAILRLASLSMLPHVVKHPVDPPNLSPIDDHFIMNNSFAFKSARPITLKGIGSLLSQMCLCCRSSWEVLFVVAPLRYLAIFWAALRAQRPLPLFMAYYTRVHHPLSFHRGHPHLTTSTVGCNLQQVSSLLKCRSLLKRLVNHFLELERIHIVCVDFVFWIIRLYPKISWCHC